MPDYPKKLLIIGPAWVGDMVMAQSLFIYLKQKFPKLIIDVLAPAWSEPLLAAMPEVRKSIVMPLGHGKLGISIRITLGKSLRNEQYDWSITLPNSWKSALLPFAAKITKRTGYKGEVRYGLVNDMHHLDKQRLTMTVQRFVALSGHRTIRLEDCPIPSLSIDSSNKTSIAKKYQLVDKQPILALCPGAEYGPAKCWPAIHYAELAKTFVHEGWQIILLGSEKDNSICNTIYTHIDSSHCYNLSGKTSLNEAIHLLSLATQVVSNDSGLMHIAAAVNRPVIAIYGSSDPKFTPPLNSTAKVAYLNLSCSPCFKRECPLEHLDCLNEIKPQNIVDMINTT